MAFTSQSGAFALRSRAGKANARIQKERGYPYCVKAREARLRKRLERLLSLLSADCCEHCIIRAKLNMRRSD
jgi:hypothetical protein